MRKVTYPAVVPPWPSRQRRVALWEWIFETEDEHRWLDQIGEPRVDWVRRNVELRAEIDGLLARLASYAIETLGAAAVQDQAREARRRILATIDDRLVDLVRRDPRYLATEFAVDRVLDARMIIASMDAALPTEMLQNIPLGEPTAAEIAAEAPRLLARERKDRELAVYREKAFLRRLAGAVASSVGKGRGSLISRVHVRRIFERNLEIARHFAATARAARRESRRRRSTGARDTRLVVEERLRRDSPLGASATERLLTNTRAVFEAALIQTEDDFDLGERTGPGLDALRKLVRGIATRAK